MQTLVKNFFDTIKKGDLDSVIQERNKLGIDVANLLDENTWKQNVMFSAAIIKDENSSL
jgi:ankyrin repeat protein